MENNYLKRAIECLVEASANINKARVYLKQAGADDWQLHHVYIKATVPIERLICYLIDKVAKE